MKEVALQLYSIGGETASDFYGALCRTAEAGFTGVEFAGYGGNSAAQMKKWLDELKLTPLSTHTNVFENLDQQLEYLQALGVKNIVLPHAPFESEEQVLKLAESMNQIGEKCLSAGIQLSYHNHAHEFRKNDSGTWLLDIFYDHTDPKLVGMQLDVCWATVGGADPAAYLAKYRSRIHTVHMKEVLTISPYAGTAIGDGIVNFKGIYDLLGDSAAYIVEQEAISTMDTWTALRKSVDYLKKL